MSWKHRLRTVAVCTLLELGLLAGGPMPPEEVKRLLESLSRPMVAHTLPSEEDSGSPEPDVEAPDEGDETI